MPLQPEITETIYRQPFTKGTAEDRLFEGVFIKPAESSEPGIRLLNLLQEAFDAGEDPDLTFDDFIRYALQGKMLTIEVL